MFLFLLHSKMTIFHSQHHLGFGACKFATLPRNFYWVYKALTEKTIFLFPFKLNGIWSWWQFSYQIEWDMIMVTVFLSNWMGYDRGDSFPIDFEPNRIAFGSKSKEKLSPRSYPIQFERKMKYSFSIA